MATPTPVPAPADSPVQQLDEMLAHHQIRAALARYTRGIDRCDRDLVASVYHPGAYDDHGSYKGSAEGFLDWVMEVLKGFTSTMHFLGQSFIDVDPAGSHAWAETYCVAYHRLPLPPGATPGMEQESVVGLRYVDRFERRAGGPWLIAHRQVVPDWRREGPAQIAPEDEAQRGWGRRDRDDPAYRR